MGVPFEFREFSSIESLVGALEKKEIDVIPSLVVQDRFVSTMDFSSFVKLSIIHCDPTLGVLVYPGGGGGGGIQRDRFGAVVNPGIWLPFAYMHC